LTPTSTEPPAIEGRVGLGRGAGVDVDVVLFRDPLSLVPPSARGAMHVQSDIPFVSPNAPGETSVAYLDPEANKWINSGFCRAAALI
jgi:hypothetical protein